MRNEKHQGVSRGRRLTKAEAAKYRKIRDQVETEIPPAKPEAIKVVIARLRALRLAKGISLSELADRTGISRGNLARMESRKSATFSSLQRYAEGLGCELRINVVSAQMK
jgi:DNA-binding Xre family transcriptional regulator